MKQCLDDDALVSIYSGQASEAQAAHLQCCVACTANYHRLTRDLTAIVEVLNGEPPPLIPARRHFSSGPPLTAVAAALLIFVSGWCVRWWSDVRHPGINPAALAGSYAPAPQADAMLAVGDRNEMGLRPSSFYAEYLNDSIAPSDSCSNQDVSLYAADDDPCEP